MTSERLAVSSSRTDRAAGTAVEVTMPQMGVSVTEGTLVVWHKQPGDWVSADETICEITTDKIDCEVPSPASGRVAELLVEPEQTVPVGTPLARIATDARTGEPHPAEELDPAVAPDVPASEAAPDAPASDAPLGAAEPERVPPDTRPPASSEAQFYSPVVQRIAQREGVDLGEVHGTGRNGRVRKQDVLAFLDGRSGGNGAEPPLHSESPYREEPAEPGAALAGEPERLSRMRRSIAAHMVESLRTAAHCTSIAEADMSRIEAARQRLGLTYLPLVARCVIDALQAHPELNATLDGEMLTVHPAIHLGIAVSLDRDGLIVPVIHDAQDLSHEGLAKRIAELARRARAGELGADDVRGGTFTITNPGGYGTIASTPIINQPQVAILDLEAVVKRPVAVSDGLGGDAVAIRPMTNLCLSWDHRALDGALAAQFLRTVRERIERWEEQ
jgi:2-oxoglutarate dehydrogenase dihydrolipoamide succinyltransferase (E2 component)